jgi:hypothetical protein
MAHSPASGHDLPQEALQVFVTNVDAFERLRLFILESRP